MPELRRAPLTALQAKALRFIASRVSKADGSQVLDLQLDALAKAGVDPAHVYQDKCSGKKDDRPGLAACLKALRPGDCLVVWRLDRLSKNSWVR